MLISIQSYFHQCQHPSRPRQSWPEAWEPFFKPQGPPLETWWKRGWVTTADVLQQELWSTTPPAYTCRRGWPGQLAGLAIDSIFSLLVFSIKNPLKEWSLIRKDTILFHSSQQLSRLGPWRAFWVDTAPFTGPQPLIIHCFQNYSDTCGLLYSEVPSFLQKQLMKTLIMCKQIKLCLTMNSRCIKGTW